MSVTGPDRRASHDSSAALERLVRDEWSQVVGVLVRDLGDLSLAEDVAQDAVTAALGHLAGDRRAGSPGAWITVTARRKALDHLRREARFA